MALRQAEAGRRVDYYRIKELSPPFTKPWVIRCLRDGCPPSRNPVRK